MDERKAPQKGKARKTLASERVKISAQLRKANPWFEALMETIKEKTIKNRRKKERARGQKLSSEQLTAYADELEELQRQMNPLENRRKELVEALLAHWGHTGINEIQSSRGRTLISMSFELCLDSDFVRQEVGMSHWQTLTERVLQPGRLFAEAKDSVHLRDTVLRAAEVRRLKVAVTSPSSRRPKSGETNGDEDN